MLENLLFVYGTLLRKYPGRESNFLKERSEFIAEGYAAGKLFRIEWYCGAFFDITIDSRIYGEILGISNNQNVFPYLDEYEEVTYQTQTNHLFVRKQIAVNSSDGRTFFCWTYALSQLSDEFTWIKSGIFVP
jgi:gamma-glutamylcyclotransferase (GGCT)/AIG2-like uncharacterized protein YtfP